MNSDWALTLRISFCVPVGATLISVLCTSGYLDRASVASVVYVYIVVVSVVSCVAGTSNSEVASSIFVWVSTSVRPVLKLHLLYLKR